MMYGINYCFIILADITTTTSNVPQTAEGSATTSEGSSVNISMETGEW